MQIPTVILTAFVTAAGLCWTGAAVAQKTEVCPIVIQTALNAASQNCGRIGRNQACYGNIELEVDTQEGFSELRFEQPGDVVDVAGIKTLRLSALREESDIWGIALMRIQANLPNTLPGQNVSFVLFGDVRMQNAVGTNPQLPTLEITMISNANVRASPSVNAGIRGSLRKSMVVVADGRSEDGQWLRIRIPEQNSMQGWVFAELVSISGDPGTLAVLTREGKPPPPLYGPMQAFYFATGLNDAPCAEAPNSGLLIQTPAGARQVTLLVNEVVIRLSSTAYLQAQPDGEMVVSIIEGLGQVTSAGVTQRAPAGTQVRLPLDATLAASGPPSAPEPYDVARLSALPIPLLERAVAIAPPLTPDEIAEAVAPAASRLVPEFVARYACVTLEGTMLFRDIDSPIWQRKTYWQGCKDFDFLIGDDLGVTEEYRLQTIEPDGTVSLAVMKGERTSTLELRSDDLLLENGLFSIWIPLDSRVFVFPPIRFMPDNITVTPDLAPVGTRIITVAGHTVLAHVYEGGFELGLSDMRRSWFAVYYFDAQSGLLLKHEHIDKVLECWKCDHTVIQTPLVERHGVWELVETNQPLSLVNP